MCSGTRGTSALIVVREAGNLGGLAGQSQDVHPRVGAVDDVDEPTVVGRDVVRLDDGPADVVHALERAAAEVGGGGRGGDEEGHVLRVVGIAHVDGAHAGVEVRDEDDLL